MTRTYFIHDNGGRPFKVMVPNKTTVHILVEQENYNREYKHLKSYDNVERIFKGEKGSSMLLKLEGKKNRYVVIGEKVFEFTAPEEITKYNAPIGNNDVPYPVAVSENYVYFLVTPPQRFDDKTEYEGGEMVPKALFPKKLHYYDQYYRMFPGRLNPTERKAQGAHRLEVTIIHHRL